MPGEYSADRATHAGLPRNTARRSSGFTLIELLVVIAIIALGYIVLDVPKDKTYWANADAGSVGLADLNGSGAGTFFSGLPFQPVGIALDLTRSQIYVAVTGGGGTPGEIWLANLDGTGAEALPIGPIGSPGASRWVPEFHENTGRVD
jgi:prepilin-type N-terminal cleavage/methylation domain-containing protein